MLLSWLSKLLASILVAVICTAIITGIFAGTLLSSHYLEDQLTATDSYSKLSTAIISKVAEKADNPEDPNIKTQLKTVVTAQYLQTKLTGGLDQLEAYYKGTGPAPSVDLSDFVPRAQAAGIPINSGGDNGFDKPITLTSASQIKGVGKTYAHVQLAALVGSMVLVVLLVALSWERHRFAAVPDVLMVVGVITGFLGILFSFAPGLVLHYVSVDFATNTFASIGRDLATSISHDLGKRLGVIALPCFTAGLVARIWLGRHHLVGTSPRQALLRDFANPKSNTTKIKN